jgi:PAS domain S-box-containing protein
MNKNNATILFAEDDTFLRKSTVAFLQQKGYRVLETESGRAAITLLNEITPDLILTDLRMPNLDGFDVLKEAGTYCPDTPVIILSGIGTMDDVIKALRLGAWDYLTKPLDKMEILLPVIKKGLDHGAILRQARTHRQKLEQAVQERTAGLVAELETRKTIEHLLEHAKQEWERTVDAMSELVALVDREHRMVRVNRPMAEALGMSPQETVGKSYYHYVHGLTQPPKYYLHQKVLQDGKNHSIQVYEKRLGGWFEISISPYRASKTGKIIGSVHIARNITHQRLAEEQLRRSKEQWKRTFDSFNDIVTLQDTSFHILKINKTGCNTLDTTSEDLIGRLCFELFHGSNRPCSDCPLLGVKKDLQPCTREIYYEVLGKTFLVSATPVLDDQGELEFIAHTAKDISQWKETEKEKGKLQAKLLHAQKLESVGQLAAGIAHEINTPTQYVSSNIDFLEGAFQDVHELMTLYRQMLQAAEHGTITAELTTRAQQALKEMDWEFLETEIPTALHQSKEGIKRVSSIIRAMKEFSHPGSNEKAPVNLNSIIETTITVARNEWKYVAEVKTELDLDLPSVNCLRDEMGQVVLNILVNAAHAIDEKLGENPSGEKGSITIATCFDADWVEMHISDTGAGIPESIKKRIFDPFFTTKVVGKGTGQGLAISHDVIVEKHGGTIEVDSEPGKGTQFLLRLPIG